LCVPGILKADRGRDEGRADIHDERLCKWFACMVTCGEDGESLLEGWYSAVKLVDGFGDNGVKAWEAFCV
jgi:hypothetical protein